MKTHIFIIFTFLTINVFSQCGREYPSGFYHNSKFINSYGDTLNKSDSLGFYMGLHLYSDNPNNIYNDTITYLLGHFKVGVPIGEWLDHCNDGSFSIGNFRGDGENVLNGKGVLIKKNRGVYVKEGIWKYFNKDSTLIKKVKYERRILKKGWINNTYIADSLDNFILINSESKFNYSNIKRNEKTLLYTSKGVPISYEINNFWRCIFYEFNSNGTVKMVTKQSKIFGKSRNRKIVKKYNYNGKLQFKNIIKYKKPYIIPNQSW
jgi:hypothetical protein